MRIRHYAAGLIAALAIAAIPASSALASPTPTTTAPANHHQRPHPEQFSVQRSVIGAVTVNDVEATGPVAFTGGTDTQLTPIRDEFSQGLDAVQVWHTGTPVISADPLSCTVTVTETGLWFMRGAAGADFRAHGSGHYALVAMFGFAQTPMYKHRPAVCPLPALSRWNVLRLLGGLAPVATPVFSDIAVHGTGTAVRH